MSTMYITRHKGQSFQLIVNGEIIDVGIDNLRGAGQAKTARIRVTADRSVKVIFPEKGATHLDDEPSTNTLSMCS